MLHYYNCVVLLLTILASPRVLNGLKSESEMWDMIFEEDVTPYTYYSLQNLSLVDYDDYKFDYRTTDILYRRTSADDEIPYTPRPIPPGAKAWWSYDKYLDHWPTIYLAKTNNLMYQAAYIEIRSYFPLRYLYLDNLEFEVGYLVYQAIHRYQMMVELYEVAHRRYYMRQDVNTATAKYMLYIYRRMLKLSWMIIHLSNMAHGLENKYEGHVSIFTVKESPEREARALKARNKKKQDQYISEYHSEMKRIQAQFKKFQKRNKRFYKKQRKEQERDGLVKFVPTYEPKRVTRGGTPRPLIYGWSIEDWWI